MKRNKIKPKYLNQINLENEILENNNKVEIIDTTTQIINFSKSLGLIILMLFWSYIPLMLFNLFEINYTTLPTTIKYTYIVLGDITFLGFIIFIYRKDFFKDFKNFFNNKFIDNMKISLKYWLIGLTIMIISNLIINLISKGGIAGNEESVRELIDKLPIYMLLHLVIYAPITEELIFRRSFKNSFNNKYLYIITTGLIFGGMHIISNITSWTQILYIIPYSALGIAFGALYKKTNNIFSTISIHAIHNFLTLILYIIAIGAGA